MPGPKNELKQEILKEFINSNCWKVVEK